MRVLLARAAADRLRGDPATPELMVEQHARPRPTLAADIAHPRAASGPRSRPGRADCRRRRSAPARSARAARPRPADRQARDRPTAAKRIVCDQLDLDKAKAPGGRWAQDAVRANRSFEADAMASDSPGLTLVGRIKRRPVAGNETTASEQMRSCRTTSTRRPLRTTGACLSGPSVDACIRIGEAGAPQRSRCRPIRAASRRWPTSSAPAARGPRRGSPRDRCLGDRSRWCRGWCVRAAAG
jgi:hypothetical protein